MQNSDDNYVTGVNNFPSYCKWSLQRTWKLKRPTSHSEWFHNNRGSYPVKNAEKLLPKTDTIIIVSPPWRNPSDSSINYPFRLAGAHHHLHLLVCQSKKGPTLNLSWSDLTAPFSGVGTMRNIAHGCWYLYLTKSNRSWLSWSGVLDYDYVVKLRDAS